jgi:two-component system sensor histidine kinase KdpD
MIDAAVARAEPLLRAHELKIVVEKDLPVIRVDARAVAEVIFTLLDNASKYSPAATEITIRAERGSDEVVRISVADQGAGIPARSRELVFEKFFRNSVKEAPNRATGIGMGLSIAKGIVEAHGGRIWIESGERGRGTKVIFTVPVGDDEAPRSGQLDKDRLIAVAE